MFSILVGNVSELGTFEAMLNDIVSAMDLKNENPVIVMDAGITTGSKKIWSVPLIL